VEEPHISLRIILKVGLPSQMPPFCLSDWTRPGRRKTWILVDRRGVACISGPMPNPVLREIVRETLAKVEEAIQLDPVDPALDRLKTAAILAVAEVEAKESESDEAVPNPSSLG